MLILLSLAVISCKNPKTEIPRLIQKIKSDNANPNSDYVVKLAAFGDKATDPLLAAWRNAHAYAFWNLTKALCRIPSEKRDDAFIDLLASYRDREDAWLAHWYASAMIDALAENKCSRAVPVLKTIVEGARHGSEVRSHALAALDSLGEPCEATEPDKYIIVDSLLDESLKDDRTRTAADVALAVIDQTLSNSTTSTFLMNQVARNPVDLKSLREVRRSAGGELGSLVKKIGGSNMQYEFKGIFVDHPGTWGVTVYPVDESTVLVSVFIVRGPLAGVGYIGEVDKINNRWLLTKWQFAWIS